MTNTPLFTNPKINLLLIIDITLIVYLCVLASGFSTLDDTALLGALQQGKLNLTSLASVGGGGDYFRPLTIVSYLFDYFIWKANPAAFHLTSLAIHIANACLVYHLCRVYVPDNQSKEGSSFCAALFFAVTPLNSESVLWISDRTDLLCCFFFLGAIIVLLDNRLSSWRAFVAIFTLLFASLLAKESSIVLIGIIAVYLLTYGGNKPARLKIALFSAAMFATIAYLLMRIGPKWEADSAVTKIASKITEQSFSDTIFKSIATTGFYIKKLLWPFPLNLAINTINEPVYFLVGIIALILIIICFVKLKSSRLPLLIIIFGLMPPLLVFHGKIPWTLYAERYLYIPMTGFALLTGSLLTRSQRIPQFLPFIILIPLAISTVYRSGQWADPVVLWQDTARKSPEFPKALVITAYELIQVGRVAEAEQLIDTVRTMKFENALFLQCAASISSHRQVVNAGGKEKNSQ
jgi:hypothetical protein